MAKDVAVPVLAHEIAHVRPQPHVRNGTLVQPPYPHRQAFEQNKALAVNELLADTF
jgi:hypothetical protein